MTLRKGQHLFNEIAKSHVLRDHPCNMNDGLDVYPYYNLHQVLFYMDDIEFDRIMNTLQNSKSVEGKEQ